MTIKRELEEHYARQRAPDVRGTTGSPRSPQPEGSERWQRDGRTVYVTDFLDGGTRNLWSAHVDGSARYLSEAQAEAIARRMAAAPELLDACRAAEEILDGALSTPGRAAALVLLRAAIAKVEG